MTAPWMVPQYYLRPVSGSFGWAVITVNERIGMLQITSDWGNWSYRWSAPGMPFKDFLVQMVQDPHYLITKLTQDIRQYRSAKKQEAWMEQACQDFFDRIYAPVFVPLLQAESLKVTGAQEGCECDEPRRCTCGGKFACDDDGCCVSCGMDVNSELQRYQEGYADGLDVAATFLSERLGSSINSGTLVNVRALAPKVAP